MKASSQIRRVSLTVGFGFFVLFSAARGQDVLKLDEGAAGTYLALKQLQTTASVLHVVAHPDDEDGGLLTYCARGLGVRTMLFSITRGEGGANLISPQFFDGLGILRTLEHLKSAAYYGNDLFYSRATDYGYSKTLEEANRQWKDGEPILADLVEVIRRERPTVLLSRFRGDSRDGHGHHQMAGVLSQRAFAAAANPEMFPDQLARGLHPWQVQKLYANNIRPRWRPEDRDAWTVAIPTGKYDPLLGRSYAQIARFGLGFQRSQGISGHDGEAGPQISYYRLSKRYGVSGLPAREDSPFGGIDTTIEGLARTIADNPSAELASALAQLAETIGQAAARFDARNPSAIVPLLTTGLAQTRELHKRLDSLEMTHSARAHLSSQLQRKAAEFENGISAALGLHLESWAGNPDQQQSSFNHAIPGQEFVARFRLANRGSQSIKVKGIRLAAPANWGCADVEVPLEPLESGEVFESQATVRTPNEAEPTRPYWSRASIRAPFYDIQPGGDQSPTPANPLALAATVDVGGVDITIRRNVSVRFRHPEYGAVRYPLTVVPAMGVRFALSHGVIPRGKPTYAVELVVRNAVKGAADADLSLTLPKHWTSEPRVHQIHFEKEDEEATFRFVIRVPDDVTAGEFPLQATVSHAGRSYSSGYQTVTARDLGRMNLYGKAMHVVRTADIRLLGEPRVGYIMGSGDEVPQSLSMLGLQPEMLTGVELANADLSVYDVILVGVRAYAVRPDIRKYNARLLDYVKQGGVLVVQYQTPEFDNNYGPYPYEMGRRPEEVSEEDSQVTIIEPQHALFTTPNQITAADFAGWLEQRGSKFWTTWDDGYLPLLECHDSGQSPQRGGMLVAEYGQGFYVYSAYAWYRQLPHGVTGAFRLFANILSLPKSGEIMALMSARSQNNANVFDSGDDSIYQIRTKARGPAGSLPLTDEMLRDWPSGDLFGLTQNAGMGWDPEEMLGPQFLLLSTQGGMRAPDGSPVALGFHTGHWEVGLLVEAAAKVIKQAGGVPFAAYCSDPCDGRTQGTVGMFDSLAYRNDAATVMRRQIRSLPTRKGVLGVATCDKGLPAMMMALAGTQNMPCVLVPGGVTLPPESGEDTAQVQTIGARYTQGEITLEHAARAGCAACGSPGGGCQFMGTAATAQVVGEALGLSLPHAALAPSGEPIWLDMARRSAQALWQLQERGLTVADIVTGASVRNAMVVHAACGGSTNLLLHLPAVAFAAGLARPSVHDWIEVNRAVPRFVDVLPNGPVNHPTVRVFLAGGVPEIMLHLRELNLLDLSVLTATGDTLGKSLEYWEQSPRRQRLRDTLRQEDGVDPDEVIIPPAEARRRGMTSTVCFPVGNLCPEGSVIKATAIDSSVVDADGVYRMTGPARVFTTEKDAIAAVKGQTDRPVKPGDVLVLIARGPLGSGMEETYQITSALKYLPWGKQVAVVTDARFSGVSTGACIGHVGPEALAGGPIGKVRDGDLIQIEVDRLNLTGGVNFVGEADNRMLPGKGAELLASRAERKDLNPDPHLPEDTRLWAALQRVGGGTWGGCVYDIDRIVERLS